MGGDELAALRAENERLRGALAERVADSEKFRALFEHAADACLILGAGGIVDCNAAAIEMLRARSKQQVLKIHPAALSPEFQPDGQRSVDKSVEMDRTAHARGFHRFEWTHRRMTGEAFPVEVTLTPVTVPGERVLLIAWHELTERKRREVELEAKLAVIAAQQADIQTLSMPVLAVWDGVVMIPVLGRLDPDSAERLLDTALTAATLRRARTVIVDLTGLAQVDTRAAHDLMRVLGAIRLVGAEGIVVGIRPAIAEALVATEVTMPRVRVLPSLRDAVAACMRTR